MFECSLKRLIFWDGELIINTCATKNNNPTPVFHLAVPTHDLEVSKNFYSSCFGAEIGREYGNYVIFNFFGHQLVTHLDVDRIEKKPNMYPRHFGIIVHSKEDLTSLYEKCKEHGAEFFEEMFERYNGQHGWHYSFFVSDPSNNLIEVKYYINELDIFK